MNPRAFNKTDRTALNITPRVCRTLLLTVSSSLLLAACATSDGPRTIFEPYVGIGIGVSDLGLEIEGDAFSLDESSDTVLVLSGGVNILPRLGVELQLADLGEAVLDSGDAVGYRTFSASAIGRVFGNRTGPELFGRLGIGALQNDEPSNPALLLEMENTTSIVAGVGAEYRFDNGLGIRLEYVGHDSDAQFVTAGINYAFGGTRQRPPVLVSGPVPDATAGSDLVVSRVDEGVAVFDEEVVSGDDVLDAGDDVITGDELPAASDRVEAENTEAGASQLPTIRPLETPAIPVSPPAPPTTRVEPPLVEQSDRAIPGVNSSGVLVREPIDNTAEDTDALLLQPLPTENSSASPSNGSRNVGQFDVEEVATPQEIPDFPLTASDAAIDSTSAADPLPVPRQPEPVQTTVNDSDALAVTDIDFDGVEDSIDDCSTTTAGIPVNSNGCDKYAGWLSGIGFVDSSSRLTGASRDRLEEIITDLQNFPEFVLELQVEATSDSAADTFLARRRTIEILRFVRSQGIAGNRLKSLPPSLPSADNPNRDVVFLRSLIVN